MRSIHCCRISGVRARSSRSTIIRHVEGEERSSSAAAAGRKLQRARDIRREPLFVRLRRRFDRDFNPVANIEAGRTEHAHLQDKPPLGATSGHQGAEKSLAAVANEHWDVRCATKRLYDMRGHDYAAQDSDLSDTRGEGVTLHLERSGSAAGG
jgi:hypothetical protein